MGCVRENPPIKKKKKKKTGFARETPQKKKKKKKANSRCVRETPHIKTNTAMDV